MPNRWAISDIHGCGKTFKRLLKRLELQPEDELYLLGDYINKGPSSKKVIKTILDLKEAGYRVRCLKGNHEDLMLRSLEDPLLKTSFLQQGGRATLKSFEVKSMADISSKYMNFFRSLEVFISLPDYVLVHAGLNFIDKDPFTDTHAMMWSRGIKMIPEKIGMRTLVHGHSPIGLKKIKDSLKKKKNYRIDIDNGCVYHAIGQNNLVALELNTRRLVVQENVEEVKVDKK